MACIVSLDCLQRSEQVNGIVIAVNAGVTGSGVTSKSDVLLVDIASEAIVVFLRNLDLRGGIDSGCDFGQRVNAVLIDGVGAPSVGQSTNGGSRKELGLVSLVGALKVMVFMVPSVKMAEAS